MLPYAAMLPYNTANLPSRLKAFSSERMQPLSMIVVQRVQPVILRKRLSGTEDALRSRTIHLFDCLILSQYNVVFIQGFRQFHTEDIIDIAIHQTSAIQFT